MADVLINSCKLSYPIVLQELAVSAEKNTEILKTINYKGEVTGVIT